MEAKKLYLNNIEYTVKKCFYEHPNFIFLVKSTYDDFEKRVQGKILLCLSQGNIVSLLLSLCDRVYKIEITILDKVMKIFFHDTDSEAIVSFTKEEFIAAQSLDAKLKHVAGRVEMHKRDLDWVESPLAGKIVRVLVRQQEFVRKGQPLLVIESMKMENELCAQHDAIVKNLPIRVGDLIQPKQKLMLLAKKEGDCDATTKGQHGEAEV